MNLFRQISILARVQRQTIAARFGHNVRNAKLMVFTLASFMLGYLVIGYFMFHRGLTYVFKIPAVGTLMAERILYLMIFFFFVMLIFSNAIISFSSLFRSKEGQWLLTLPIDHRAVFCWRILETLIVSSWGLIFLSAPLLAAYGQLFHAPPFFYVKSFLIYLPFVAIPAAISGWILLLIIRFAARWWKPAAAIAVICLIGNYVHEIFVHSEIVEEQGESIALTLNQVLRHTEMSVNPFVPSSWMSDNILQWAKGYGSRATFFTLLLISNSLMACFITVAIASPVFYGAWNQYCHDRARKSWRRTQKTIARAKKRNPWRSVANYLPVKRSTRALVVKDALCFLRDPSQWVQCAIVFGLLFLYVFNLKNMGYDFRNPFWLTVISFLNFGVCSLALSTLATRFIFPQFSLEGGRLWILGMAPFGLHKVVIQKAVLSTIVIATVTVTLMLVSGIMLQLPPARIGFFMGAICLMSVGLTSLSVGLGALFPTFHEPNPAKVVSGFGGTLCLILNFVYIVIFIAILVYPATIQFGKGAKSPMIAGPPVQQAEIFSNFGLVGITILATTIPLYLAIRNVKKLELLGNL